MSRLPDPISIAALVYLATPAFVFALGWLELPPGLVIAALISIALFRVSGQLPRRPFAPRPSAWIYLVVLAATWAAFSGAGHFFYANTDWLTRDAVYADLILSAWPPGYGMHDGASLVLRTAMGYFLPPALLANLAGIQFAPSILFAWTATGVALFLLLIPLPREFGWRLVCLGLLIVFFSGMDFPAVLLVHGHLPIFPLPLEWWLPWTYTSLTGQLFWAPNHALALWLGTALFYRHRADPALPALALVLLPLLLLWTPFAVIGLLPWFLWATARLWRAPKAASGSTTLIQWMLASVLTAVVAALFSQAGVAVPYSNADPAASAVAATRAASGVNLAFAYIQFVAFEFGLLVLLLRPRSAETRQALAIAAILLLLLPLIRLGPSNDWLLRVSTPSLLVLMLLALAEFDASWKETRNSPRLVALAAVLTLGAITPLFEFSRAVLWSRSPPNYGQSLVEQQRGFLPPHYLGRLDLTALKILLRPPSPVPQTTQRQALLPPSLRHRP